MSYRTSLFLLGGMISAALCYLLYDKLSALKDGVPRSCSAVSSAAAEAGSVIPAGAGEAPAVYLGIEATDLDPAIAAQLEVRCGAGVLITSVKPGSPADLAGLKRGDVIIEFNNRDVDDLAGLRSLICEVEPADAVRLVFIRDGTTRSAYVLAAALPEIERENNLDYSAVSVGWDMTVGPLTDEARGAYAIPEDMQGVIILSVAAGGKTDSAGIRQGDVIRGLDGSRITDMTSFAQAVYSDSDDVSVLDVYSRGQVRYVAMDSLGTAGPCLTEPVSLESLDRYALLFRLVPLAGVIGLVCALLGYLSLFAYSPGDEKMRSIADKIHSGAAVFLRQEYKTAALFLIISSVALFCFLCLPMGIAFLVGSACSMLPGWIGMKAATTSNSRTCQAARQEGLRKALLVAFRGGSVMGISVASVGIIGLGLYSLVVLTGSNPGTLPFVIAGFCLGASFFALFGRVAGGIFTKSADIGADMAGKLEFNLPEDDPRNPAVIADNVGDNVGDVAGMGSDLFESYTSATVATIIMGLTMQSLQHVVLPLVLMATGLICCLLTVCPSGFLSQSADPQTFLRRTVYVANGLFLIGAYPAIIAITGDFNLFLAAAVGVLCGLGIGFQTEYFGSGLPIRYITRMSGTGAATNIIAGLSVGFMGSVLPIITICITVLMALYLAGLYGIGLSAVAMLASMGVIMSIDAYGPIVDNAGGIATMSGAEPELRRITDKLDVAGNISAAIGKGFTIGAGVITTIALFAAYVHGTRLSDAELFTPSVLVGLLIGVTLPLVFAAWTMGAVTRIANKLVVEIGRQFRETTLILAGAAEPDANRCVAIITRDSLRATVVAGIIAIVSPFVVFFTLGLEALAGFLVGAMLTGSVLGLSMAIGGVAWDNAKKRIERERARGRATDVAYGAAVVGDMVGDPFKDVAGPSMNILIKLMVTITLVFCSVFCASQL